MSQTPPDPNAWSAAPPPGPPPGATPPGGGDAGPPPGWGAPPPPGNDRRFTWLVVALVAALLVAAVAVTVVVVGGDDGDDDTAEVATEDPDAGQEVFTEPAGYAADAFTASTASQEPPPPPATTTSAPTTAGPTTTLPTVEVAQQRGGEPGLYGGTKDQATCDVEQLVEFLEGDPVKGRAWAETLGIEYGDIRTYVDGLTPVLLRSDTRVTNHGFRGGRATAIQVVLQAGTAVLVDRYGTPVTKCYCGNPLLPPRPSKARYYGPRWDDFDPSRITVVVERVTIVETYVLYDQDGDGYFSRPTGTVGDDDLPPPDDFDPYLDGPTVTEPPPPIDDPTTTEPTETTQPGLPGDLSGTYQFDVQVAEGSDGMCTAYSQPIQVTVTGDGEPRTITLSDESTSPVSTDLFGDGSFRFDDELGQDFANASIEGRFTNEGGTPVIVGTLSASGGGLVCNLTFRATRG